MDESLHFISLFNLGEEKALHFQKQHVLKVDTFSHFKASVLDTFMMYGIPHRLYVNYESEILMFFEQEFLQNKLCCKWFAREVVKFLNYFGYPDWTFYCLQTL